MAHDPLNPSNVHVLVPDQYGMTVVDLASLLTALDDNPTLDEALTNAGIDSTLSVSPNAEQIIKLVGRVRHLNATGDVEAFWASEREPDHG